MDVQSEGDASAGRTFWPPAQARRREIGVHGEPESLEALAPVLQPHVTNPVEIPERLATYEV